MRSSSESSQPRGQALVPTRRCVLVGVGLWPLLGLPNAASAQTERARVAIKPVAHFDETTWAQLLQSGPRPAAYVFTTSYCSTCPDAFDKLQTFIKASRQKVELAAVLMDVPAERVLAHAHHYAGATRFYAFDGFAPAIRQSVDPKWPNVTPYVVLLERNGAVQRTIGPPEPAMLKRWLA
ncbi:hypothetical protein [Rhodoferax sp.]|uniref:hypothetical protein n=1 Tax=Rhodoferax sp. TaxID=50421 RepID=UPI002764C51D|nr:hypothetical protein [Rhodoferax sp.]